jgi:hypothetical protein
VGVRTLPRPRLRPLGVAGAALIGETAVHLANRGRMPFLDSGYEWSYSHLAATAAYAAGTAAGVVGARRARRGVAWWAVSGLFAFLLIDNVTRLHDHVASWPVLYAPVLFALSVAVAVIASGHEDAPLLAIGVALLVASLALHVLGPGLGRGLGWWQLEGWPYRWPYELMIALKEGSELAGWTLCAPTLVVLAARRP